MRTTRSNLQQEVGEGNSKVKSFPVLRICEYFCSLIRLSDTPATAYIYQLKQQRLPDYRGAAWYYLTVGARTSWLAC